MGRVTAWLAARRHRLALAALGAAVVAYGGTVAATCACALPGWNTPVPNPTTCVYHATGSLYLCPSGNDTNTGKTEADPVATVAKAWSLAQPGMTISAADGTYNETGNPNWPGCILSGGKAYTTTITGSAAAKFVCFLHIEGVSHLALTGITVQRIYSNGAGGVGGATYDGNTHPPASYITLVDVNVTCQDQAPWYLDPPANRCSAQLGLAGSHYQLYNVTVGPAYDSGTCGGTGDANKFPVSDSTFSGLVIYDQRYQRYVTSGPYYKGVSPYGADLTGCAGYDNRTSSQQACTYANGCNPTNPQHSENVFLTGAKNLTIDGCTVYNDANSGAIDNQGAPDGGGPDTLAWFMSTPGPSDFKMRNCVIYGPRGGLEGDSTAPLVNTLLENNTLAGGASFQCTHYGTTLASSIDDQQTAIVTSSPPLPSGSGISTIFVGSEQMTVTAGIGTTSLTVVRGVNGTTRAAHTSGDAVGAGTCPFGYTSLTLRNNVIANSTGICPIATQLGSAGGDMNGHNLFWYTGDSSGSLNASMCGATNITTQTASQVGSVFVDYQAHDYHLKAGSPALNAADPGLYPSLDRDRKIRACKAELASALPDIGAYERCSTGEGVPKANVWMAPQGLANGAGSACSWHDPPVVAPANPQDACGDIQAVVAIAPSTGGTVDLEGGNYLPTGYSNTGGGANYTAGAPPGSCDYVVSNNQTGCWAENSCRPVTGTHAFSPDLVFQPALGQDPHFVCQQAFTGGTTGLTFRDDHRDPLDPLPGNLWLGGIFPTDYMTLDGVDIHCLDQAPYPLTYGTQAATSPDPNGRNGGYGGWCSAMIKGSPQHFHMYGGSVGPQYLDSACASAGVNASWDNSIGYAFSPANGSHPAYDIIFDGTTVEYSRFGEHESYCRPLPWTRYFNTSGTTAAGASVVNSSSSLGSCVTSGYGIYCSGTARAWLVPPVAGGTGTYEDFTYTGENNTQLTGVSGITTPIPAGTRITSTGGDVAHTENFYVTDTHDITFKNMMFTKCGSSTAVYLTRQSGDQSGTSIRPYNVFFLNDVFNGARCGVNLGYMKNVTIRNSLFPVGGLYPSVQEPPGLITYSGDVVVSNTCVNSGSGKLAGPNTAAETAGTTFTDPVNHPFRVYVNSNDPGSIGQWIYVTSGAGNSVGGTDSMGAYRITAVADTGTVTVTPALPATETDTYELWPKLRSVFSHDIWAFNVSTGGYISGCGNTANGDVIFNTRHDPLTDMYVSPASNDWHLKPGVFCTYVQNTSVSEAPSVPTGCNPAVDRGDLATCSEVSPDIFGLPRYKGAAPDAGPSERDDGGGASCP